jgi:hypothetical protein
MQINIPFDMPTDIEERKFLLEIAKAVITGLLALAALILAGRQYRTQRNKLRLDLYERRYALYQEIVKMMNAIIKRSSYIEIKEAFDTYALHMPERQFLFRHKQQAVMMRVFEIASTVLKNRKRCDEIASRYDVDSSFDAFNEQDSQEVGLAATENSNLKLDILNMTYELHKEFMPLLDFRKVL